MPMYRQINKNFFKKWTPDMAYVLGFFAADGNMIKNRRGAHFISLQVRDGVILRRIKGLLGSEHKIGVRIPQDKKHSKTYRIQIGSKNIFDDLERLGFKESKTNSMVVPFVPGNCFSHFVRGYFDGDGNVWSGLVHKERKRPLLVLQTVFTSCSHKFLVTLMKKLEKYDIKGKCRKNYTGNYFRLTYSIQSSRRLFALMYRDCSNGLYLPRKRRVFERFMKNAAVV